MLNLHLLSKALANASCKKEHGRGARSKESGSHLNLTAMFFGSQGKSGRVDFRSTLRRAFTMQDSEARQEALEGNMPVMMGALRKAPPILRYQIKTHA